MTAVCVVWWKNLFRHERKLFLMNAMFHFERDLWSFEKTCGEVMHIPLVLIHIHLVRFSQILIIQYQEAGEEE